MLVQSIKKIIFLTSLVLLILLISCSKNKSVKQNDQIIYSNNVDRKPCENCLDILKIPSTDTFDSSFYLQREVAFHSEFCRMAKQFDLNKSSFDNFSKAYAKKISSSSGSNYESYMKIFSGDVPCGHDTSSESENLNYLKKNLQNILTHYNLNCSGLSYEEWLQHEVMSKQKIVHSDDSKNWMECMVNNGNGLYAFLSNFNYEEGDNQFKVFVGWKTNADIRLLNMIISYDSKLLNSLDNIASGSRAIMFPTTNMSETIYSFESLDANKRQKITFNAETMSGDLKISSITLPRRVPLMIKPVTKSIESELKLKDFYFYLDLLLEEGWIDKDRYVYCKKEMEVPGFHAHKVEVSTGIYSGRSRSEIRELIWELNPNY